MGVAAQQKRSPPHLSSLPTLLYLQTMAVTDTLLPLPLGSGDSYEAPPAAAIHHHMHASHSMRNRVLR
ncbi:hypothetical protein, partial [Pantoea sp. Ft+CA_17]|uniref:hypothetical protein n=1 Tax=Pantoea sp. Ft+CA_17 TaxID=2929508 RepID=UPI0021197D4A